MIHKILLLTCHLYISDCRTFISCARYYYLNFILIFHIAPLGTSRYRNNAQFSCSCVPPSRHDLNYNNIRYIHPYISKLPPRKSQRKEIVSPLSCKTLWIGGFRWLCTNNIIHEGQLIRDYSPEGLEGLWNATFFERERQLHQILMRHIKLPTLSFIFPIFLRQSKHP